MKKCHCGSLGGPLSSHEQAIQAGMDVCDGGELERLRSELKQSRAREAALAVEVKRFGTALNKISSAATPQAWLIAREALNDSCAPALGTALMELVEAVTEMAKARGRMRDDWSEAKDDGPKRSELWRNLHTAGNIMELRLAYVRKQLEPRRE